MVKPRDFRSEYDRYHGLPEQRRNRSLRNQARRKLELEVGDDRECDHVIPLSKGGTNDPSNLRAVSFAVNRAKSNKLEDEVTGLIEVLVRQQKTRTGFVFKRREAAGPPPSNNPLVDELLHVAAQHFDFSPIFSGDQQQSRQAAQLFREHVLLVAREVGAPIDEVKARLKELQPFWIKSFRQFLTAFKAGL